MPGSKNILINLYSCDFFSLFLHAGTGETAKNLKYLLDIGVTHLLNTAENDVNVNPKRYTKEGISYKGFRCPDLPQADIAQFFDESVEFIDRALSFSCGKVFVNCLLVSLCKTVTENWVSKQSFFCFDIDYGLKNIFF